MRNVFLALLTANVLFMAWSHWVDTPREANKQDSLSRLPRLLLETEAPHNPQPTDGTAQKMVLGGAAIAGSCTSLGPFNDMASAARTAAMLLDKGFTPQQRAEDGETVEGYWVYVSGMKTDDEVARAVDRLEKSGFTDAHVMKESPEGRRVSVGLFSKRDRAERRAAAVKHGTGLDPQIGERKFPGTVYWVDVGPRPGTREVPADVLVANSGTVKVGTQACPSGTGVRQGGEATPQQLEAARQGERQEVTPRSPPPRTKVASAPNGPP